MKRRSPRDSRTSASSCGGTSRRARAASAARVKKTTASVLAYLLRARMPATRE